MKGPADDDPQLPFVPSEVEGRIVGVRATRLDFARHERWSGVQPVMLEIAIEADEGWDSSRSWEELVHRAAEAAIAESAFPQLTSAARQVELSVRLTSNDEVQALNAQWRGKDKPTNVLSFPMLDESEIQQASVAGPELLLGDIILAHGVCEQEASDKGVSVEDHATHLMVHGTLHLLGYDHHQDDEAADMEAREIRALQRLGIANPYEEAA